MVSYLLKWLTMQELQLRLNPYCSGQWSSTDGKISKFLVIGVLILIVVDNGLVLQSWQHVRYLRASLNLCCSGQWSSTTRLKVWQILVVGLNPCCSGQWSSTIATYDSIHVSKFVLILIVVVDGLVLERVEQDSQGCGLS